MSMFFTVPSFIPSLRRGLNQKKHCPILPHLGFGTLGHGIKWCVFGFTLEPTQLHARTSETLIRFPTHTFSFHVTRARYGSEFLPSNSGRTLVSHNLRLYN